MISRLAATRSYSLVKRAMSSNSVSVDAELLNRYRRLIIHLYRFQKALVLGIYAKSKGEDKADGIKLTPFAQSINEKSNGKLLAAINT